MNATSVQLRGATGLEEAWDSSAASERAILPVASAINLPVSTATNVLSLTLAAGIWDISANLNLAAATATVTQSEACLTTTSGAMLSDGSEVYSAAAFTLSPIDSITLPVKRFTFASQTTVFLVGKSVFSAGTISGFGCLLARSVH